MKLGNFSFINELDALRRSMGAKLIAVNPNFTWKEFDIEIIVKNIEVGPGGIFIYEGQKIVVYIRDYNSYFGSPKFHLTNCLTLRTFQNRGTYQKYFATNRTDGYFKLNLIDNFGKRVTSKEEKLEVCKHCLSQINYKNYRYVNDYQKMQIYNTFNLAEYLENSAAPAPVTPKNDIRTTSPNIYTEDFPKIAIKLKEQHNWTCKQCKQRFIFDKHKLHVHHKNELKWDNSPTNLEVLCVDCHQTKHKHKIVN